MDKVRVGIIGVGGISKKHIKELLTCENAKITAVCDINEANLKEKADQLELDEAHRFRDYHDLIACEDVDAVEICTPNYLHVPMALDVVKAGKKLNVEKPLALSAAEAQTLADALKEKNTEAMMCFSWRFHPAVLYAKTLLEQGVLGEILDIEVAYLKDSALWPGRKLEWRFVKEYAGTGVLGDLGVHLLDMARLLIGEFKSVCGRLRTAVHERPLIDGEGMGKVETDDYASFLAEMEGGVNAIFNITRAAYGVKNTVKFDIHGMEGSISFNLNNPKVLGIASPKMFPDHPEMHEIDVPEGYDDIQEQTFADFAQKGEKGRFFPSVEDGVACQKILDAIELSAKEKRWVDIV
ncbi:MAG: Gfo/Idh/MocA family oxidoreductase [Clostridiales bacterium]|nr:Gfo/Idh/MocA family oxidoreductase [Clostridiales bacterium]